MMNNRTAEKNAIWHILSFTRPHVFWLLLTVFVSIAGAVLTILTARYLGVLTDQALLGDYQGFVRGVTAIVIVLLTQIPINYLNTYGSGRYAEYSLHDIRSKTMSHIQSLPASYIDKHPSGELMSKLTSDVNLIQQFLQSNLKEMIALPITFVAAVVFLLVTSFRLSLFSFAAVPVFIILTMVMTKPIEKYTSEQQEALAEVNTIAQDMISGMTEAKSFQLEEALSETYDDAVNESVSKGLKSALVQAIVNPVNTVMQFIPFILIFAYGGYLIIQGNMSFGALITFLNLTNAIVNPLGVLPRVFAAFRSASAAGTRILAVWDQPAERSGENSAKCDLNHLPLDFCGVSFAYNDHEPLFQDLSFTLKAGETTAIAGPSGCGKSTVLKIITGLYKISDGSISIFGRDINDWCLDELREQIAWVSQDTYLFPDTIYENIACGRSGASEDQVMRAASEAGIHAFIQSLPEGYNSQVGERGVKLSGGQRQRISIARAILKDAPILLLDEATSALDAESEHLVQSSLEQLMGEKTTLVIAHRLSTIKTAANILVMDKGKIVETGSHQTLLELNGLYSRLYQKQMAAGHGATLSEPVTLAGSDVF